MVQTRVSQQMQMVVSAGPGLLRDVGIKPMLVQGAKFVEWDKVRFVGTLLRVRGMAKSLFGGAAAEFSLSKEEWFKWLKII